MEFWTEYISDFSISNREIIFDVEDEDKEGLTPLDFQWGIPKKYQDQVLLQKSKRKGWIFYLPTWEVKASPFLIPHLEGVKTTQGSLIWLPGRLRRPGVIWYGGDSCGFNLYLSPDGVDFTPSISWETKVYIETVIMRDFGFLCKWGYLLDFPLESLASKDWISFLSEIFEEVNTSMNIFEEYDEDENEVDLILLDEVYQLKKWIDVLEEISLLQIEELAPINKH